MFADHSQNVCILLVYFVVESSGHFHNCIGVVVRNDVTNDVTVPAAGLSSTCYSRVREFLLESSSQVKYSNK